MTDQVTLSYPAKSPTQPRPQQRRTKELLRREQHRRTKVNKRLRSPRLQEKSPADLAGQRLYSRQDLKRRGITFSDAWLHRLISEGRFPKPIKFSNTASGVRYWIAEEVEAYIDTLIAKRDEQTTI
jgi:predicted DNA-binding transcriptional regulator AlpA